MNIKQVQSIVVVGLLCLSACVSAPKKVGMQRVEPLSFSKMNAGDVGSHAV